MKTRTYTCQGCGEVCEQSGRGAPRRFCPEKKCQQKADAARSKKYNDRLRSEGKETPAQRWRKNNPERARENDRHKRATNPELYREINRRKASSVTGRANRKAWKEANPEKAKEISRQGAARYRARSTQNEVFYVTRKDLDRLARTPCVGCGSTENLELDHIIPVARGGRHSIGNLQSLCRSCNASKNARLNIEWRSRAQQQAARPPRQVRAA